MTATRFFPFSAAVVALCLSPLCRGQTTRPASQPATTQPIVAAAQSATTQPVVAVVVPPADSFLPGLSSDTWQKRQAAVDDLVRMGEEARPIIHELLARQLADAETRTRLEAALAQVDENRIIGPSFITLHMKDATAKAVFAELSRQCYVDLKPFPDNLFNQGDPQKITIDIDRKPFWEAMTQITEKTGIDLQQYNEGVRLMRGGFRMNSPFSAVQGPFLVVATQLTRTQTEMLAGGGSSSDFSMQMMVYSEPKLHILSTSATVTLEQAVDDAGNSLLPTAEVNRGYYGGSGGCWNLMAELKFPDHPGKKIAAFHGSSAFLIQTRSQQIQIPDVRNLKEVSRVVGDMPVVFHDLKKNAGTWELRFSANPQASGANRWAQFQQSVQTNLQLLDEKGQPFDHRGMRSSGNNNSVEFTLLFSPSIRLNGGLSNEPEKLFWEVPTASKEIRVPLEFKDLPMPK